LKAELKSKGGEIKHEGWDPKKVKRIVIEFRGHVNSKYQYPINPTDLIETIIIIVEE